MDECMFVCAWVSVCMHAQCVHTHAHTHTHTRVHTHRHPQARTHAVCWPTPTPPDITQTPAYKQFILAGQGKPPIPCKSLELRPIQTYSSNSSPKWVACLLEDSPEECPPCSVPPSSTHPTIGLSDSGDSGDSCALSRSSIIAQLPQSVRAICKSPFASDWDGSHRGSTSPLSSGPGTASPFHEGHIPRTIKSFLPPSSFRLISLYYAEREREGRERAGDCYSELISPMLRGLTERHAESGSILPAFPNNSLEKKGKVLSLKKHRTLYFCFFSQRQSACLSSSNEARGERK